MSTSVIYNLHAVDYSKLVTYLSEWVIDASCLQVGGEFNHDLVVFWIRVRGILVVGLHRRQNRPGVGGGMGGGSRNQREGEEEWRGRRGWERRMREREDEGNSKKMRTG